MKGLTVLVAARDEEDRIGETIRALRETFPDARVVIGDDGSRDGTAQVAAAAGARVIRLPRRGKGQALSLAERQVPPGPLLLCDADLRGNLTPLRAQEGDVVVAVFAESRGGGFGIAKRVARALIRARSGFRAREPLSGQRLLSETARAACFPLAPGFGAETRMTIDAVRAGLEVAETELRLTHRATGRDPTGFLHRGRQLGHIVLSCGPLAANHRGLRLPLVGWLIPLAGARGSRSLALGAASVAMIGLADDLWSGPERGVRLHLRTGRTTGMLKLVGIPAIALAVTRRPSAALLVALSAHVVNLLDTRPGRALKGFLLGALVVRGPVVSYAAAAVFLCPYDLREMVMLGDGGSNTLGAVLGFGSVTRITGRSRWMAIGALLAVSVVGETRSLGRLIETTPGLSRLDRLGRQE